MEKLKNDKSVILRFSKKIDVDIYPESQPKKKFKKQSLTNVEVKDINEIICLGNKITKGYWDEINNSGSKYDTNAKIIFEPWKEYEISQTNLKKLSKVFRLGIDFLKMNRKIEFEFSCPQKIKMLDEPKLSYEDYLEDSDEDYEKDECQAIKKLLKDNSL